MDLEAESWQEWAEQIEAGLTCDITAGLPARQCALPKTSDIPVQLIKLTVLGMRPVGYQVPALIVVPNAFVLDEITLGLGEYIVHPTDEPMTVYVHKVLYERIKPGFFAWLFGYERASSYTVKYQTPDIDELRWLISVMGYKVAVTSRAVLCE